MRTTPVTVLLVLSVLLVAGCGDSSKPSGGGKAAEAEPQGPEIKVDPATAGTLSGSVVFEGAPPADRLVSVEGDPYCLSCHPEGVPTGTCVVGPDGGLANAFVYVKKGLNGKFAAPSIPVVLDQTGCQYSPHVVGIQTRQPLLIRNSDSTMHNVHAVPKTNEGFNFAQTKKGDETTKAFPSAEVPVRLKCDAHGWMSAYVCVVGHPYYQVTKADGRFELSNLPPGEYVIEAWHEKFGRLEQTVKVEPKGKAEAKFTFKAGS